MLYATPHLKSVKHGTLVSEETEGGSDAGQRLIQWLILFVSILCTFQANFSLNNNRSELSWASPRTSPTLTEDFHPKTSCDTTSGSWQCHCQHHCSDAADGR